jgi:hypothetical protein
MTSSATVKTNINLSTAVAKADSSEAAVMLKRELEQVDGLRLPLQQGLTRSSFTDGENFGVTILSVQRDVDGLHAKAGILYQGIILGCSCADDPTPQSTIDEYCEIELVVAENGYTTVTLLNDSR